MSDIVSLPLPARKPRRALTDIEVSMLGDWARRSTVPGWPTLQPPGTSTPPEMIERLIGEWIAFRAVLDLVGEFSGDLRQLLARLEEDGA